MANENQQVNKRKYKIIRGTLTLGHEEIMKTVDAIHDGKVIQMKQGTGALTTKRVECGRTVELTDDEARPLLAAGTLSEDMNCPLPLPEPHFRGSIELTR